MTKEQAIEWLKSLNYCDGEETQEVAQAIEQAIKALEQPTSDDCVSRQAVLDKAELVELEDGQTFYSIDPEDVKSLSPVAPICKVGKWLSAEEYALKIGAEVTEDVKKSLYKFCPFCEQTVFMERNFCPNCGASFKEKAR